MKWMTQELRESVTAAIGYTTEEVRCQRCKHIDEHTDQTGTWSFYCSKFEDGLGVFTVTEKGRCDKFEADAEQPKGKR